MGLKEKGELEQPKGRLERELRSRLAAAAAEEEVQLVFTQLGQDPEYLNLLLQKRSVEKPEAAYEITLVSGKRKKDKALFTSGHLLAIKGESGETACLVLGSVADMDGRLVRPVNAKEPVFVEVAPGEEYFTIEAGKRDWFRHMVRFEDLWVPGNPLAVKVDQLIGDILLGDREELRKGLGRPVAVVRPGRPGASELTVIRDGERRIVVAREPEQLRPIPVVRANIMQVTPVLSAPVEEVKREVARLIRGSEAVDIASLPEGLPTKVEVLLGAGAVEIKRLGIDLSGMTFGGVYEGKKEKVYSVVSGDRKENGEFVVQVVENLASGELNLIIGIIVEQGEGRNNRTVSVRLNYENSVPVVVEASMVELAVSCDGQTVRDDYSAKDGHYQGSAGGRRESKAANWLAQYFSGTNHEFAPALHSLHESTRKTYGWLGK